MNDIQFRVKLSWWQRLKVLFGVRLFVRLELSADDVGRLTSSLTVMTDGDEPVWRRTIEADGAVTSVRIH